MRILGIDPGSVATGYGIVERVSDGERRLIHVAHGTIRPPRGAPIHQRLAVLHREIARVIADHSPDQAVVEQVFVAASARSALVLGQARGAALAALGQAGLPVAELAAREIKKAIVGTGGASKVQVQAMVTELLGLETRPASDAADALAGAICHGNANRLAALGVKPRGRSRGGRARSQLTVRRAP